MAIEVGDIVAHLRASNDGLNRDLDKAEQSTKTWAGRVGGFLQNTLSVAFGNLLTPLFQNILTLGPSLFEGAMQAQEGVAQLDAVLKSTGGSAGVTKEQVLDLSNSIAGLSTYEDDAILEGENLLLTFTNIGSKTFPMATQAMVDMAAAMKTDVKSGAIQLGKALNDPIKGVGALSEVGVTFTDEQKKMIETLVKTGDMAGAQTIILNELNREFGGSAQAQLSTTSGKWKLFTNNLKNAGETIAGALLPIGSMLLDNVLTPMLPAIEGIAGGFSDFVGKLLGSKGIGSALVIVRDALTSVLGPEAGGAITSVLAKIVLGIQNARDVFVEVGGAVQEFFASIVTGEDPVGDIANLFYSVAESLGLNGEGIFGAITALRPLVDGLMPVFNAFGRVIEQVFQGDIVGALQTFAESLYFSFDGEEGAGNIVTKVLGDIMYVAADFVNWLQTEGPNIASFVQSTVSYIATQVLPLIVDFVTNTLLPTLNQMEQWFWDNLPAIQATAQQVFQGIQSVITTVVTTIVPFVVSMFQQIVDWFKTNWPLIQQTFETVVNAIKTFWDANGATIMKTISDTITIAWETIKLVVTTAIDLIGGVLRTAMQIINGDWSGAWETIKTTVSDIWANVQAWWDGVGPIFEAAFKKSADALQTAWSSVWAAISGTASGVWTSITDSVKSGINSIIDELNKLIKSYNDVAVQFKMPSMALIPRLAKGTENWPGGPAIVGDEGPEALWLPKGTAVTPAAQTATMRNAGGMTISIGNISVVTPNGDIEAVKNAVKDAIAAGGNQIVETLRARGAVGMA